MRIDKLGAPIAALMLAGATLLPFATFSANRIVLGAPRSIAAALGPADAALTAAAIALAGIVALLRTRGALRLGAGLVAAATLTVTVGRAAAHLTPPGDAFARVSPGAGFWVLIFAVSLLVADGLTRLRLAPAWRLAGLAAAAGALALLLSSGGWDDLSILKEYATRADAFWREGRRHLALAFGALGLAVVCGVPLGVLAWRSARLRAPLLGGLNVVQTIPSIALFGLLIAPLAWVAAVVPGARAIGVAGVGAAPALVALFAYSLLPIVANTVVGLDGVPRDARDAASGMGMTAWQKLIGVEAPLAFPVILAAVRIVLVQNIGLATIAALIGGGGFGVFVFQGMGQTATDLILLGAAPTVLLAFAAAVTLDALIEMTGRPGQREREA